MYLRSFNGRKNIDDSASCQAQGPAVAWRSALSVDESFVCQWMNIRRTIALTLAAANEFVAIMTGHDR